MWSCVRVSELAADVWDNQGSAIGLDRSREALMANKDKGGRSNKKAPAKTLKEKRSEKKSKKSS